MGAGGAPLAAPVALLLQEAQQAHRLVREAGELQYLKP